MALGIDEFYMNFIDSHTKKRVHEWNKLEDTVLWSSYDVFIFHGTAFYFRMFFKIIDKLIPTGVMDYLIKEHYTKKWKFQKSKKKPNVLNIDNLGFGFNIWLGFCMISFIGFMAELLSKRFRKPKKIKYAKIYPSSEIETTEFSCLLGPKLIKKFKIKTNSESDEEKVHEIFINDDNITILMAHRDQDDTTEDLIADFESLQLKQKTPIIDKNIS